MRRAVPADVDQNVFGMEVSMVEPTIIKMLQTCGDVHGEVKSVFQGGGLECAYRGLEQLDEISVLIVLHDHESISIAFVATVPDSDSIELNQVVVVATLVHHLDLLVKQLGDLGWGVLGVDQTLENDDSLARGPMGTTNLTVATLGDPLALGELCEVVVMGHGWSCSHGCDHVEDRGQEIVSIDPFRTVGCLRRDGR